MEEYQVRCSFDGREFKGVYSVEDGLIFVRFGRLRKATQVGGLPPSILARQLLHELVEEAEKESALLRELKRRQARQCQAYLDLFAAVQRAAALKLAGKASATDPEFLRLLDSADEKPTAK